MVHTLDPWLVRIEQAIIKDLLIEDEKDLYFPKFNVDGQLRGDYESRMRGFSIGISNGIISPNEARRKENMPPIPEDEGGDSHIVNGTFIKLRDVGKQYNVQQEDAGIQEESGDEPGEETGDDPDADNDTAGDSGKEEHENRRHAERHERRRAIRRGGNQ